MISIESQIGSPWGSLGEYRNTRLWFSLIMARNWNKIWRYLHLSLGLLLVVYHARIAYYHQGMFGVTTLWSAEVDEFVSIYFIFFVMWTGLAKWPIYPWYKKRQNRKKREAKEAVATE